MILITPLLLILISTIFYLFPPKRINRWYGYRTSYSMQNQNIWDYANKVGARYLLLFAILLFIFDCILAVSLSDVEQALNISFGALISGLIITIVLIERKIKKK